MKIHMEVPESWNNRRKKLMVSWKTVLDVGIDALERKTIQKVPKETLPEIEKHFQQILKHVSGAWDIIKRRKD